MHLNHSISLKNRNRMQRDEWGWEGMLWLSSMFSRECQKSKREAPMAGQYIYIEIPLRIELLSNYAGTERSDAHASDAPSSVRCSCSRHVSLLIQRSTVDPVATGRVRRLRSASDAQRAMRSSKGPEPVLTHRTRLTARHQTLQRPVHAELHEATDVTISPDAWTVLTQRPLWTRQCVRCSVPERLQRGVVTGRATSIRCSKQCVWCSVRHSRLCWFQDFKFISWLPYPCMS
jgi:hypothetical protein